MTLPLPTALAALGFASAIALLTTTLTNLLGFPLASLSLPALVACSLWLALGFWACARGMATVKSDELRQMARFGLYLHGIAMFASTAGLAA